MPFASDDITVRRLDDDRWTVVHEITYQGRDETFTVPAGFVTDFATVPVFVTWLVPRFGAYTAAAVLHDWLIESAAVTPRDADGLFRRVMREAGVPVIRRWLIWCGVRWGAAGNPRRRPGWWADAPAVLAITVLAAPVVIPPALCVLAALVVYGAAEGLARILGGDPR